MRALVNTVAVLVEEDISHRKCNALIKMRVNINKFTNSLYVTYFFCWPGYPLKVLCNVSNYLK